MDATTHTARSLGEQKKRPGVVWISGYSASGKTTVGRKVKAELTRQGIPAVFLDGDDLRSIFAGRWGYERKDRIELARIYFRLSSHLASQGLTVVISAVAMYSEVREWIRTNIPGALEIFLSVPHDELLRRDGDTKRIYDSIGDISRLYDEPDELVLSIDNFDARSPDHVAAEIVAHFLNHRIDRADFGRLEHWTAFYTSTAAPAEPSSFARTVARELKPASRLLDVGCGNGRDAAFLASLGHVVTAIDPCSSAIELCRHVHQNRNIRFFCSTLPDLAQTAFDAIYCRFVMHAMPLSEELELLASAAGCISLNGRIYIECRSINDPLARLGEVISPTERIHGHYRRFIVAGELLAHLVAAGFRVLQHHEAKGIAVQGNDDPVVIRVIAERIL